MTRKHFKALADALRDSKPGNPPHADSSEYHHAVWHQWLGTVRIADACAQFNPGFKRETFYNACGYNPAE